MPDARPLADFLRARREQLSPADVGLRATGRRRTPGLRREELATLAGVSIDYLIRIEQGRDTNPSPAVLRALADALHLDEDERMHLGRLAIHTGSHELCPSLPPLVDVVPPSTQQLLDGLATPAFVLSPLGDVVADNAPYRRLVAPWGLLEQPNLAVHLFRHADARRTYADWEQAADAQVARLRSAAERWQGNARFEAVHAALVGAPGFDERWSAHVVAEPRRGATRLVHPEVGSLDLRYEVMGLADHDQQLVAWLPADDATAAALRTATSGEEPVSPAVLRVVGER